MMKVPEQYRYNKGPFASTAADGNNGCFMVPHRKEMLVVIASDGMGWEHVSVSLRQRCPTWDEMCFIKSWFWSDEDCVVQYHPPKGEYVNNHNFCLHLWRPIEASLPSPPHELVGIKATQ